MSAGLEVIESWNDEHNPCQCGDPKGHKSPCGYSICDECSKRLGYKFSHGYAPCPPLVRACNSMDCSSAHCRAVRAKNKATIVNAEHPVTAKTTRAKIVEVKKTVEAHPACTVCHFAFSKPVTFCPNCGARR